MASSSALLCLRFICPECGWRNIQRKTLRWNDIHPVSLIKAYTLIFNPDTEWCTCAGLHVGVLSTLWVQWCFCVRCEWCDHCAGYVRVHARRCNAQCAQDCSEGSQLTGPFTKSQHHFLWLWLVLTEVITLYIMFQFPVKFKKKKIIFGKSFNLWT